MMPRPRKYPDKLIQRGVWLAIESGRPISHVAADLGIHHETLRKHVRQAEAAGGLRRRSARRSGDCAKRCSSCAARLRS